MNTDIVIVARDSVVRSLAAERGISFGAASKALQTEALQRMFAGKQTPALAPVVTAKKWSDYSYAELTELHGTDRPMFQQLWDAHQAEQNG